jgi:hypothetical protein
MEPFISESMWLQVFNDLVTRGGVTKDGRRLWNPQMDNPDKVIAALEYFAGAVSPGSYKQSVRLKQAITKEPGPRGEKYEIDDEVAGFYGLRQIKLEPLKKMDFKLNEYLKGEADTRKLYSVPTTKGGRISDNDIIENFFYANRKKFELMADLKQGNEFAKLLNVRKKDLEKVYDDRKKGSLYDTLQDNRFKPFEFTEKQEKVVQEQYENIIRDFEGIVYNRPLDRTTQRALDRMIKDMSRVRLTDNFNGNPIWKQRLQEMDAMFIEQIVIDFDGCLFNLESLMETLRKKCDEMDLDIETNHIIDFHYCIYNFVIFIFRF